MLENRRKLLLVTIGVALLAIVGVVIIALVTRPPHITVTKEFPLSENFNTSVAYDDSSLLVSNNYALVAYNYMTGQTKQLSDNDQVAGLIGIDSLSLSSDKQTIVFHDAATTPGSVLDTAATTANVNTTSDHWWVFHQATKTFQPLRTDALLAKIYGDKIYVLTNNGGQESITAYNTNLQQVSSINIPLSSNFFVTGNTFLLQTSDNKLLTTTDGVVSKLVRTSLVIYGLTTNAVAIGVDDAMNMVMYNPVNDSSSIVDTNIIGKPAISGNLVLYQSGKDTAKKTTKVYDTGKSKTTIWNYTSQLHGGDFISTVVAVPTTSTAVVGDNTSHYYLIGSNIAPIDINQRFGAPALNGTKTSD